FTLVLMHFGTYLQDYFTRQELNRVLPVIYAGGRVGGIAGGRLLEDLSALLGPLDVVPVFVGLCLASMLVLVVISHGRPRVHAPEAAHGDPGTDPVAGGPAAQQQACVSIGGFLHFAWASPLLFWTTVCSLLYMVVRWFLNYEYNRFFETYFADSTALAEFLGRYTQVALLVSLAVQLLVVNRLVAWLGVRGAYLAYGVLLCTGTLASIPPMTLAVAMLCRLIETELRFGLRNPLMQLLSNHSSKPLRLRVRAWTIGVLTPVGTLTASLLLGGFARYGIGDWITWLGGTLGLAHLAAAVGLY